jgi:hypothetical protein
MQRFERDHHLNRGAIGVGDNAPVSGKVVGVDLGHHQRDALIHTPGGAVIDDDRAGLGRHRREFLADIAAG